MFWDQVVKVRSGMFAKVVMFLAKNNYMVYLFHTRGIEYVVRKLSITEANILSGFLVVIGAYLISLLLAFIANLCLKPIQSLLNKILANLAFDYPRSMYDFHNLFFVWNFHLNQ